MFMTESLAIAKYCARLAGCTVEGNRSKAVEDMFEGYVSDLFGKVAKLANMPVNEETAKARSDFKNSVISQIAPIEKHLGMMFKWVCGDKLSWVDFFLHQVFENEKYKKYCDKIDFKLAFGAPLDW